MLFINTMHLNWNSSHYGFIIKWVQLMFVFSNYVFVYVYG
jgi:hypothetical protein